MANPHSAQAAAQVSPPISASSSTGQKSAKSNGAYTGSGPGSPPYLSTTPAQSAVSQKSWQEKGKKDLSPKAAKSGRNDPPRQSRPRRTSRATSAKSDAGASEYSTMGPSTFGNGTVSAGTSVNGDDSFTRPDYYSALELDADTSSEDMSGSDMSGGEDDYGDDLIPVTGFAVASTKRNQDFHEVFPTVPEGDYLIEGRLLFIFFVRKVEGCRRLRMRTTKRNSHSRATIHLGKSYLFPCKYFWLDHRRESSSLSNFVVLTSFLLLLS